MKNEALIVKFTNGVAVGGLTMPAWWPSLAEVSTISASLVPILSVIWLTAQLVRFFRTKPGEKPDA